MYSSLIKLLEPLIGSSITINNQRGIIIDILDDPPALVMSQPDAHEEIRMDYLGRPQEISIPRWTVSLFSEKGNVLHPDLQRLLDPETAAKAQEILNTKD